MPHTKQDIQRLLQNAQVRPRRRWGQNFLIDLNLMRLLVDHAGIDKSDVVLEVGTGTGSLTSLLAARAAHIVTVDIDPALSRIARDELVDFENITFFHCDALANKNTIAPDILTAVCETSKSFGGNYKLVANLPYQIASPLMINLILHRQMPAGIYVTIQAEVADRILAKPGSKAYGMLSIFMQATGQVRQLKRLSPQVFWPMPKVHSAMITWKPDQSKLAAIKSLTALRQCIDLLLGHRRKKIKTCLERGLSGSDYTSILEQLDIDPHIRGELLWPEQYVELANALFDAKLIGD